jgi:hypothetical protein
MPFAQFEALTSPETIMAFFEEQFSDVISLVGGKDALIDMVSNNPVGPLITVKVRFRFKICLC